jgi:dTDP-4-amino-4,6-dideoxygalactose transaminase
MYFINDQQVEQINTRIAKVARSRMFVLGDQTADFESYCEENLLKQGDRFQHSLLVSNGTVAIELALIALARRNNIRGGGVLMPVMTVPMVKWAIEKAGFTPIMVDVNPQTHCMDINSAMNAFQLSNRIDFPIVGIVFVYTGGLVPFNIEELCRFAEMNNIFFVEDISHAYQTTRLHPMEWKAGCCGDAVCGSMFATKTLSVGEGGIVGFNDKGVYDVAKVIRNQGRNAKGEQVLDNCYNYRASEYTAAIARVKVEWLYPEIIHRKVAANIVRQELEKFSDCSFLDKNIEHDYYKLIVRVKDGRTIEESLRRRGYPVAGAVHRELLCPKDAESAYPGAIDVIANHLCPPLNSGDTAEKFVKGMEGYYAGND